MDVNVIDCLAALIAGIDDKPETACAVLAANLSGDGEHSCSNAAVAGFVQCSDIAKMSARKHDVMLRRLRSNVRDSDHVVIAVNLARGKLTRANLAKDTIVIHL